MASWIKGQLNDLTTSVKKTITQARNQSFLEAVIAAFSIVAHANGVIKPEEKAKLMGFIETSQVLSSFTSEDINKYFDKYQQLYTFDAATAEASALQTIGKIKSKTAEARLLVRVCVVVGKADGDFDANEQAAVVKICNALDLNPADFELDSSAPPPTPGPASPVSAPRSASPVSAPPAAGLVLNRGQRIALNQQDPGLKRLRLGLGWEEPVGMTFDLDASAFMLAATGKVRSEADFIFYNQPRSSCGAVQHQNGSEGDKAVLLVELDRVPADIQKISLTVTIHDAEQRRQRFAQLRQAFIRLLNADTRSEIARYDLSADAANETAMIFGELYRHQSGWRFAAIGQGYVGGLGALCQQFGIAV